MIRKKAPLILILLLAFSLCLGIEGPETIMPLNQVKAGMEGKGRSVFEGDRIEEFNVEILGVLRNVQPKKSIILARLEGDRLKNTGVVSGMSGSPVYVQGKLVGAVAYSFPYAKEAIAGITPIEEMLNISGEEETPKSSFSPRIPLKKHLDLEELFELGKEYFLSKSALFSEGQTFKPLNIPLVFGGFSSAVFERAKSFFSPLGFDPVMAGPSGQELKEISAPDLMLKEGDPVAVQLISGDLSMAAVGTVSYVDGSRVLAFGHPIYNLGTVDYAMSKAKVITVVPSVSTSFKLTTPEATIGRFSQDRASGVLGEIGKLPQLIPINVNIKDEQGLTESFKIEVVDDRILTPVLTNFSLLNLLAVEARSIGDLSLNLEGDLYLENGMSVHLEDLYSGNFDTSINDLASLISAVVYFLVNNEFKELGIHRLDINIRSSEEVKFSYLEKVWLDKYEVSPGEKINIKIYSRSFRGEGMLQELSIYAPPLPSGSEFDLVIADATSLHQIEMSQYKRQAFVPRSLNQLIRILNHLRKNNRIYLKIIASKPGLFLKGEEMPNLPPTMKAMFSSPRAAGSSPTELDKSTLGEIPLPVPYVFKGLAVIPIKIKK
ncbi:MAG: SpoIVB peptidase S55 domain-containing protein [Candidatus Aminicenantes bacterium]